jgi:hypothetical protein
MGGLVMSLIYRLVHKLFDSGINITLLVYFACLLGGLAMYLVHRLVHKLEYSGKYQGGTLNLLFYWFTGWVSYVYSV